MAKDAERRMEMVNNYFSEKQLLEEQAQANLSRLEGQFGGQNSSLSTMGATTLIVGGLFVAGLIIGRKLFKKKKINPFNDPDLNQLTVQYPKEESYIAKKIKEHIALFLIALLKERFAALMSSTKKTNVV